MPLDPAIADRVAHLHDASLAEVMSGAVRGIGSAAPIRSPGVIAADGVIAGVRVRHYRPASASGRALPVLVWAHGGGWQFGSLDMPEADSVARVASAELGIAVVSVDYRLAPLHRHPAAVDDLAAVVAHVVDGQQEGLDESMVVLGGASAGAHLAAVVALDRADEAARPGRGLVGLWLAYPVTDPLGGPYLERDLACPAVLWYDRAAVEPLVRGYVGDGEGDLPAELVPAGRSLTGLPPTLVTTAHFDGLAAQGEAFAQLVRDAGVVVEHHHVDDLLHGYLDLVGDEPAADRALADHLRWLAARVAVGDPPGN